MNKLYVSGLCSLAMMASLTACGDKVVHDSASSGHSSATSSASSSSHPRSSSSSTQSSSSSSNSSPRPSSHSSVSGENEPLNGYSEDDVNTALMTAVHKHLAGTSLARKSKSDISVAAHQICHDISGGAKLTPEAQKVASIYGLSLEQSGEFIGMSVEGFCHTKFSQLTGHTSPDDTTAG